MRPASKFKNIKETRNGMKFSSKKEARRHDELMLMQKFGIINSLQLQVKYELIPPMKLLRKTERAVHYVADFVYYTKDGQLVVEDVKGIKTRDYIIKRKMMAFIHGIEILET